MNKNHHVSKGLHESAKTVYNWSKVKHLNKCLHWYQSVEFQPMQLNSQQQKAAEYDGGHVLVLAGAGTGKTRTIIARAAHLIRNSVSTKRILLLTLHSSGRQGDD